MTKIFLDSCIIIYLIEKYPIYASSVETAMKSVANGIYYFSPLVRLECLVMPLRTNDAALQKLYASFFKSRNLLNITSSVYNQAAQLRADFSSLKTPDAIHLATAEFYDCDEFWTNDNRLDKISPNLVKNILTT